MNKELPCGECGGQCCTYPGFSRREFKLVRHKYGIPAGAIVIPLQGRGVSIVKVDGFCPWLKNGKCSIYEDRPEGCRLYGKIAALPCKYLNPIAALKANASVEKMLSNLVSKPTTTAEQA